MNEAQIVSLKIKNFLSVSDVEIKPGKINQIVGANNNGKTTVLKALEFAVKGSSDPSMVKNGENAAEVIVELADSTVIRRRVTSDGNTSVSVKKGEFSSQKPQTFLDGLFETFAFNPLELLDPKKRTDAIMKSIDLKITPELVSSELGVSVEELPPVDYDQHGLKVLDSIHKYFYQRRAEANKDHASKYAKWSTYNNDLKEVMPPKSTEAELQSQVDACQKEITDLNIELTKAKQYNTQADSNGATLGKYENAVSEIDKKLEECRREIEALETRKKDGERVIADFKANANFDKQDISGLIDRIKFAETSKQEIVDAAKDIRVYDQFLSHKKVVDDANTEAQAAAAFAKSLTDRVDALAGPIKAKIMSNVEMPVENLTYIDNQFFIEGVAVDNLSSSKALKLAMAVAKKLSKNMKLICIDGCELLDAETYKSMHEEMVGSDFTFFISKVGEAFPSDSDKVFEMKDGAVQVSP